MTNSLIAAKAAPPNYVTITPSEAAELLENKAANRPISRASVGKYERLIKAGHFIDCPNDAVVVNKDGRLINGQHRLTACVRTQTPIRVVLTVDDDAAMAVMDTGQRRSLGQVIGLTGIADGDVVASIARAFVTLHRGNYRYKATDAETIALYRALPNFDFWRLRTKSIKFTSRPQLSALLLAAELHGGNKWTAHDAADVLVDGIPKYGEYDAMHKAREWLIGQKAQTKYMGYGDVQLEMRMRVLWRAWIKFTNAEHVKVFRPMDAPITWTPMQLKYAGFNPDGSFLGVDQ